MSWLNEVVECTKEMEAPKSFYYWSALAAVSAILKDKVYINRGGAFRLYPNIYVLLYGTSGLRKGHPINLAKKMVIEVDNTRVISGRSSIQAIIKDLSEAKTKEGSGGKHRLISDSAGFVVASEFSNAIIKDPTALTILTDLYDRMYNAGEWRNMLKSGVEDLKNPTITMLGGVNEAQFKDTVSLRDTMGGFIGRTFIILEKNRGTLNSLWKKLENPPDASKLAVYLKRLACLEGEVIYSEEVGRYFDSWYREYFKGEVEDETGSALRILENVLKVAMLLSLSEDEERSIKKHHIDKAIELVEPLVFSAKRTVLGQGKASLASQTATFLTELLGRPEYKCLRKDMLAKHWRDFDAEDCDRIANTMVENNAVTREMVANKVVYTLTERAVGELQGLVKK